MTAPDPQARTSRGQGGSAWVNYARPCRGAGLLAELASTLRRENERPASGQHRVIAMIYTVALSTLLLSGQWPDGMLRSRQRECRWPGAGSLLLGTMWRWAIADLTSLSKSGRWVSAGVTSVSKSGPRLGPVGSLGHSGSWEATRAAGWLRRASPRAAAGGCRRGGRRDESIAGPGAVVAVHVEVDVASVRGREGQLLVVRGGGRLAEPRVPVPVYGLAPRQELGACQGDAVGKRSPAVEPQQQVLRSTPDAQNGA